MLNANPMHSTEQKSSQSVETRTRGMPIGTTLVGVIHTALRARMLTIMSLVVLAASLQVWAGAVKAPVVNRVRLFPAPGHADKIAGGRIIGSNSGETVGFTELCRIQDQAQGGEWLELSFENAIPYRWVKYEGPDKSHSLVAEVEFYDGPTKLTGKKFGVAGTRQWSDDAGKRMEFDKALDGDTGTWFDSTLPSNAYVGLDLGTEANITPTPTLNPAPGRYDKPQRLAIAAGAGGPQILYTLDASAPGSTRGQVYAGPVELAHGFLPVAAVAIEDGKFPFRGGQRGLPHRRRAAAHRAEDLQHRKQFERHLPKLARTRRAAPAMTISTTGIVVRVPLPIGSSRIPAPPLAATIIRRPSSSWRPSISSSPSRSRNTDGPSRMRPPIPAASMPSPVKRAPTSNSTCISSGPPGTSRAAGTMAITAADTPRSIGRNSASAKTSQ